jgi:hypothetical protein
MNNTKTTASMNDNNIDDATIKQIGLRISDKPINAQTAQGSRIFDYPHLENVFVMESDLYGNPMPKNSCFLAFNGKHGMIGKHLTIETLINSSMADIRHIVESNTDG